MCVWKWDCRKAKERFSCFPYIHIYIFHHFFFRVYRYILSQFIHGNVDIDCKWHIYTYCYLLIEYWIFIDALVLWEGGEGYLRCMSYRSNGCCFQRLKIYSSGCAIVRMCDYLPWRNTANRIWIREIIFTIEYCIGNTHYLLRPERSECATCDYTFILNSIPHNIYTYCSKTYRIDSNITIK